MAGKNCIGGLFSVVMREFHGKEIKRKAYLSPMGYAVKIAPPNEGDSLKSASKIHLSS